MKENLTLIRGIRFSPTQWAAVEEHARQCGLPSATYVRQTALKAVPRRRCRVRESNVIYHLGRIGNNLNQLARRHNAGEPVARAEVLEALAKLRAALKEI